MRRRERGGSVGWKDVHHRRAFSAGWKVLMLCSVVLLLHKKYVGDRDEEVVVNLLFVSVRKRVIVTLSAQSTNIPLADIG